MGDLSKMIQKVSSLDLAIENALKNEVADVVKEEIVLSAIENVYDAYEPDFWSRRGDPEGDLYGRTEGGITDPDSVKINVSGTELIASDDADWQHLWGGAKPSGRLAEAIATGDWRYHMDWAGPRPFHEKAKERLISSGKLERALRAGLKRQGIDASGVSFKFI